MKVMKESSFDADYAYPVQVWTVTPQGSSRVSGHASRQSALACARRMMSGGSHPFGGPCGKDSILVATQFATTLFFRARGMTDTTLRGRR